MKLKTKLVLLVFFILAVSMGACAAFSIARLKEYSLSVQVESEREKLRIAGRAFRQVGTREDFENMGEIARDAYLKYQFGRCYQSGYALIKDGVCIANQTDYEIVNLDGLKGEYMVQELGKKHILLLRRALEYPDGFEVLAARDISVFDRVRRRFPGSGRDLRPVPWTGLKVPGGAAPGSGRHQLRGVGQQGEGARAGRDRPGGGGV